MSNCSDCERIVERDLLLLRRLFEAVASEWEEVAGYLHRLEDEISAHQYPGVQALQYFDLLQQRAHAQAHFLGDIGGRLHELVALPDEEIEKVLDRIPFHHVRQNYAGALNGRQAGNPAESASEVDWF